MRTIHSNVFFFYHHFAFIYYRQRLRNDVEKEFIMKSITSSVRLPQYQLIGINARERLLIALYTIRSSNFERLKTFNITNRYSAVVFLFFKLLFDQRTRCYYCKEKKAKREKEKNDDKKICRAAVIRVIMCWYHLVFFSVKGSKRTRKKKKKQNTNKKQRERKRHYYHHL